MFTRVVFFDKTKNWLMPYDSSKYSGFDYFWRVACSSVICMSLTLSFSYPFELIHTRTCSDMSRKGQPRLFTTTFDCFNRTNLDEGRWGTYKGAEVAIATSLLRATFQLPVYELVKRQNWIEQNFSAKIGSALISGLLVTTLLYPLDTVKRSLQTNGGRGFLSIYSGSIDCAQKIAKQGGLKQFYRGAHLCLLTSIISAYT